MGWYNFERLIKTLLKKVIGAGVTSFGGSKDGGRDATFAGVAPYPSRESPWGGEWVFQVKYVDDDQGFGNTARSSLKSKFKQEIQTVRARRNAAIENYVLITNVPLTAGSRAELADVAIRAGQTGNFTVIDGHEVCEWLDIHPELRRSFPQLLGLSDLNQILNSAIYSRSKAYFEQWAPRLAVFVQTDAFIKALQVLSKHRFLVLDGPPETGKSMIAAAVTLLYASEGFEVYDIRSPEDMHAVMRQPGKKLFVADDAIGSVSLQSDKNDAWARDLPGIVRSLDKDRLLIWTARHYILEAALSGSALGDALDHFPGEHEVVVEVGDLSQLEKAEILYNHAKRARLAPGHRSLIRRLALTIVLHPNFTPERIRQLVERLGDSSPSGERWTSAQVSQFLTNPGARWVKAYKALSGSEQALLIALLDLDESPTIAELRKAYENRIVGIHGPLTFQEAVSRLKHSFVTVAKTFQRIEVINFKHPSLRDLLLSQLRGDPTARRRYIELTSPGGLAKVIEGFAVAGSGPLANP